MKRLLALGFFGIFLFFSLTTSAWVPQRLNYQGRLTDDTGSPITTTTTLRFSLYQGGDFTTPGSGTLVYEEDATVTPDSTGVFDHTIGSGTVVYGTLDASVFQTTSQVFLEITVDPAGLNETLLPRKQIVTVGYSFKSELAEDADKLDGQHAAAFAPVGHHHDAEYVNEGQADSVTSAMIANGAIDDADIASGANIAATKINRTGLDADLLDGTDSTGFVSTAGDDMTGTLSVIATGATYALYAEEQSTSGYSHGLYAQSNSTSGTGVTGYATATSGTTYGVYGESNSASGFGVYGRASDTSGTNWGVLGKSDSINGYGVYGLATASSGYAYGVYGRSNGPGGRAVYGYASATGGYNYGVVGYSKSSTGTGVYGFASADSGTTYGVYGKTNSSSGYAGYFKGNAHVTGELTVGGSKPCVQPIDNGKKVLLYAMESPEIWFEDFGSAKLVNGQAVVPIESVFTQAANTEIGYFVFPIPNGECQGLYISRKDKDSFEVRELGGGTSSISFDYRIVAKRRGYEDVRFEEFTEPEKSPAEVKLPVETKAATVKQPQRQ